MLESQVTFSDALEIVRSSEINKVYALVAMKRWSCKKESIGYKFFINQISSTLYSEFSRSNAKGEKPKIMIEFFEAKKLPLLSNKQIKDTIERNKDTRRHWCRKNQSWQRAGIEITHAVVKAMVDIE